MDIKKTALSALAALAVLTGCASSEGLRSEAETGGSSEASVQMLEISESLGLSETSVNVDDGNTRSWGDVDGDGRCDISDVSAVVLHINGQKVLGGESFAAADVNGDGDVDIVDVVSILGRINGISEEARKPEDSSIADFSEDENSSADASQEESSAADTSADESEEAREENTMTINVGGKKFTAHFYDTQAAREFGEMLPLTLEMSELNGNEKYIYLDRSFSAAAEKVGHISKGEIMLYGSDCVVLFYDSFDTPYSYTRLGYIDDPDGLEEAVGKGGATVSFSAD